VSESEQISERSSEDSLQHTHSSDLGQRLEERAAPEREGLPRGYRMRADAHYVDQLGSPAQSVVRPIAVAQIECRDLPAAEAVELLTKSILHYGVLQPLIVRRQAGKFTLIAGRKRLAAAMAARLNAVPCVLHDVEGPEATALAEASNVRFDDKGRTATATEWTPAQGVLDALSADLATIRTSISLLRTTRGGLPQQVGTDLLEAQLCRVAWLASCTRGSFQEGRRVPLGVIVQQVADNFAAHARLAGLQLECSVNPYASTRMLPEGATVAAITGGLFATASYLEDVRNPSIELNAAAAPGQALTIDIIQRSVRLASKPWTDVGDHGARHPEILIPAVALRLAMSVTASHSGSAELTPLADQGSAFRLTYPAAVHPVA
jgi:hypothetical protein